MFIKLKSSLSCVKCKFRNYKLNKMSATRLEIKKFCKNCGIHVLHKEEK